MFRGEVGLSELASGLSRSNYTASQRVNELSGMELSFVLLYRDLFPRDKKQFPAQCSHPLMFFGLSQ